MKILFFGTPEFASYQLKRIVDEGFDVAAVVTVPDKPSGRGLKVNISSVKREATELGIPVLQPVSLKDPLFIDQIKTIGADIFIVVAFRMLPREVWSIPRLGTFNLHASLLPDYRGAAPINWAIINGEKKSGVTTFMIDEQIDTGAILLQESLPLEDRECAGTLHDKLMILGADLIIKTIHGLQTGTITPQPQNAQLSLSHLRDSQGSIITPRLKPAPKLTKELSEIDWTKPIDEIDRLIRGLSPHPVVHGRLESEDKLLDMKIYIAEPVPVKDTHIPAIPDNSADKRPGKIVSDGKSFMYVKCADGYLSLIDIQPAGKRKMNIKEFLAGFREPEKWRFIQ